MKHTDQPLIKDEDNQIRFQSNPIVRWLLDTHPFADMNVLAVTPFDQEDREHFLQLIGYPLSGYSEISYVSDEAYQRAVEMADSIQNDEV
jgi:hypothetical protein